MAVAGIRLDINADELKGLRENIQQFFPKKEAAEVLGQAIERALAPALVRLRENTPLGPTGNLRRAVDMKVIEYPNNGVAVGILGYRRAKSAGASSAAGGSVQTGPDRGYHQWWLEYGTQQRVVDKFSDTPYRRQAHQRRMKSGKVVTVRDHIVSGQNAYIASSFNRLGPFKIKSRQEGGDGRRLQTEPQYPRAFFKKSKEPVRIPAMQPGGTGGRPPLQSTWNEYQGKVADSISRELRISLEQAWEALRQRVSGSVTGTDTL